MRSFTEQSDAPASKVLITSAWLSLSSAVANVAAAAPTSAMSTPGSAPDSGQVGSWKDGPATQGSDGTDVEAEAAVVVGAAVVVVVVAASLVDDEHPATTHKSNAVLSF